jgi:ABC-type multidrug transport system ATPase subunit
MLQRLALARALAHDPQLLLFDEPSAALDPAGAAWLAAELAAERAAGRIVVLVTHDLDAAAAIADQVVVLRRGRVVFDETRAARFAREALRDAYEASCAR